MLRVKILASVLPLVLTGIFAGGQLTSHSRPCIAAGATTLQIAEAPWQAQSHVSFTENPRIATVRVQIVNSAEMADFTVIDDIETAENNSCSRSATYVGIADQASATEPVIYLSQDEGADYRVYVSSKTFSAREAAALIVGAGRNPASQASTTLAMKL
jgi:hypothetical protein